MGIPTPNFMRYSVTISSVSKNTAAVILRAVGKVFPPLPRFLAPISIRISANYNANTGPCIATEQRSGIWSSGMGTTVAVVLKNLADSTALQNLKVARDWDGLCCRSCPSTISARLSATLKTGVLAPEAVDTPIAYHLGP